MVFPSTVDGYIESVFTKTDFPPVGKKVMRAAKRLYKRKLFRPLRVFTIKRLFALLNKENSAVCKKVRFLRISDRFAYSRDGEFSVFDLKTAVFGAKDFITCIVLHEAAHAILAAMDNYGELKALDRAFFERFNQKDAVAISPIEYYATLYSIEMLEDLETVVKDGKLEARAEHERKRLQTAYDIIIAEK